MARRPVAPNLTLKAKAEAFVEELSRVYQDGLHKELWFHSGKKPEETLYRWWWEFMKANERMPDNTAIKHVGAAAEETLLTFGELGSNFLEWWERRGKKLFAEHKVPRIVPLIHENMTDEYVERNGVPIFLPLGVSRKLIHAQIDVLLDYFHANKEFKRHQSSSASLKIFSKHRHRETDFKLLHTIWEMRQHDMKTPHERPLWKIFCLASGKEQEIPELELLNRNTEDERNEYGKRCSELLKVAEDMMRNALRGSFPNDTAARASKSSKKTKRANYQT
jgi:hypothetical protein